MKDEVKGEAKGYGQLGWVIIICVLGGIFSFIFWLPFSLNAIENPGISSLCGSTFFLFMFVACFAGAFILAGRFWAKK